MTIKQEQVIEQVKQEIISKLLYTARYTLNDFITKELPNGDIKIAFEIRRTDYSGEISYQSGVLYVTPKGSRYYINYMHTKKPLKTIQSIAGPFYCKDDEMYKKVDDL